LTSPYYRLTSLTGGCQYQEAFLRLGLTQRMKTHLVNDQCSLYLSMT